MCKYKYCTAKYERKFSTVEVFRLWQNNGILNNNILFNKMLAYHYDGVHADYIVKLYGISNTIY